MSTSAERFYAQKDANFKHRVYNILYNDSAPHSEQEALALIDNLCKGLPPKVIQTDGDYAECVDNLINNMKTS